MPMDMFHRYTRSKDGRQPMCKGCRKQYDAEFWQKKRTEYQPRKRERRQDITRQFKSYKEGLFCTVCGESARECLDFHHIKGEKELSVADAISRGWSMQRIHQEIEKCVVLCANCHRKVHAGSIKLSE